MAEKTIDIILADDHEIFRDGFRVMLSKIPHIRMLGEACNGEELIALAKKLKPKVIITDIKMPVMDGIEATRQLKLIQPETGVIALSMFDEENLVIDMLEAGAKGYLLKNATKEEIINAVTCVSNHKTYYCSDTSSRLVRMIANGSFHEDRKPVIPVFNDKEITVIQLICQEFSNKEIAEEMKLSRRTVEGYREKILEKMDAKNAVGIVVYAIRHKLYEYPS